MLKKILHQFGFLDQFLNRGHARSIKAKKNILASFALKGVSIAISLILIPLTIDYVDSSQYGIWLTLSGIVGWFSFFDIGLTQGLRNKFAEAKAKGNEEVAQTYVSTTYAILGIICTALWILFFGANYFLNWSDILKVDQAMSGELSILALIVFSYFCLQFVMKIITTLMLANQEPAKSSLIDLFGQVLSLVVIYILVKTTEGSLINLGLALCVAPLIPLVVAHFILFKGAYRPYRPLLSKVNFSYSKGLFNLGMVFFIIQIAGIIQFESANIIIARNFEDGGAEVTAYNIVYKYFGITNMIFTISLTPFWSASTEAFHKNDIDWIRNSMRKYNYFNLLLLAGSVVLLLISNWVYDKWLGEGKVNIPFELSLWGFIFMNLTIFGSKYVYFLNGISALRLQFWACILSPVIYIVAAIILIDVYHVGPHALFIASVVANLNAYILAPFQYYQIIVKKKKGIWIR